MGSEDFYDLRIAYPFSPTRTYLRISVIPSWHFCIGDEFSEWGKIDALEITLRIFNSLLEQLSSRIFR